MSLPCPWLCCLPRSASASTSATAPVSLPPDAYCRISPFLSGSIPGCFRRRRFQMDSSRSRLKKNSFYKMIFKFLLRDGHRPMPQPQWLTVVYDIYSCHRMTFVWAENCIACRLVSTHKGEHLACAPLQRVMWILMQQQRDRGYNSIRGIIYTHKSPKQYTQSSLNSNLTLVQSSAIRQVKLTKGATLFTQEVEIQSSHLVCGVVTDR